MHTHVACRCGFVGLWAHSVLDFSIRIIIIPNVIALPVSSVVMFTQERIEQLQQLSKQPDIYDRLARALGEFCFVLNWCST